MNYNQEYYLKNKEEIDSKNYQYYWNNRDFCREFQKKYYEKNKEKILEQKKSRRTPKTECLFSIRPGIKVTF